MSIDINSELKRMSEEFGIIEKEVATNFRQAVRSMWSDSVFKKDFYKQSAIKVKNENPRSMKRFPYVTKYKCAMCGEYFTAQETELDHLDDENPMSDIAHAEDFIKTIFFTSPDKLQILCKDKKKKVKGKSEIIHFGCHGLKTYASRYDVSLERAKAEKLAINLVKLKQDKIWLEDRDLHVPSNAQLRRDKIVEYLLSETQENT